MIDAILSKASPLYGFCSFNAVDGRLIECGAKKRLPENCKSIIVFLFPYNLGEKSYDGCNISRYAAVPDYHKILSARLEAAVSGLKEKYPQHEFVSFADNSPIPEVKAAAAAGLGVVGKNGLLINKLYGSWVFIGEIVTSMKLEQSKAEAPLPACIECGKCIRACPSEALNISNFEKKRCLSDVTQRKGTLTEHEETLILKSGYLWGCDICQTVCPMNKDVRLTDINEFIGGAEFKIRADGDISDRAYAWRGKAVLTRNMDILNKAKE